ncbi:MAG: thioredoxin family protein [Thermoguttaceae bacterium]|nr:thioredoxin family protein [Thermoguttaceae bacterium]
MFKFSSRLGCRFACIFGCAILAFGFETFFCTDSAFAVGRRGRVRNSQMYSGYSDPMEFSYSDSIQYSEPVEVPAAVQTPAVPPQNAPQSGVKSAPQTASAATPKTAENPKGSETKPAGLNLALRTDPAAAPVAPAPEKLPEILCYWFQDLKEASKAASSLGRPMLIHFYIENCGPCNWMEHQVFTQAQIQKLAGSYFVMVKLNGHENPDLCSRLGIASFPADVIVSADGKYITHSLGRQEVWNYSEFLTAAANQVKLPPMNKPVGPNWQKKLQLAQAHAKPQAPAQPKEPSPEMTAALEMPALDPPAPQEDSAKQENAVEEHDLFALSSPAAPAKAGTLKETLPLGEELDLMALSTKQEIQRKNVLESSIDHVIAASDSLVVNARENTNPRPSINPTSFSQETKPVLEGFSPVALVDENRWVPGNENLTADFESAQYCFASEGEKEKFLQNPRYYALVSGGCDVVILAESSRKVEGDRRFGVRYEEQNFVFSSAENLEKFRANPDFYTTKIRELAWRNAQPESMK